MSLLGSTWLKSLCWPLLVLFAGSFQIGNSSVYPLTQADGTATVTPGAYLPFVSRSFPLSTTAPTPTSTPASGCSTTPSLIGPANGNTLDTLIPLLQWDSGNDPDATELELEIWLDPELTDWVNGLRTGYQAQGINQWRINTNLDPSTTHYWRAYLMCGSTLGPYSEVWSFTTGSGGTILPGPSLLSPDNGSTLAGTTATLQWSSVNDAVEYWVWYSGGGWDRGTRVQGAQTTLSLSPNTTYDWCVQARNDYALGNESTHWQFTTGASGSSISLNLSSGDHIVVVQGNSATIVFEEQDTR